MARPGHAEAGKLRLLGPDELHRLLRAVPKWRSTGTRLVREWTMPFPQALAFFQAVGNEAERVGHHPDLHLTKYRNVRIELWTHKAGGLTEHDVRLAGAIDAIPEASAAGAGAA